MSLVWSQRSCLYLVGVAFLMVATLAFAAGHVAPFWIKQIGDQVLSRPLLNIGLWFQCRDNGNCEKYQFSSNADSLKATRILQILGLSGLVLSVAAAFFANCRRQHPGRSFFLEISTAISALLGFSGAMVYLASTLDDVESLTFQHYDWAFALNIGSSILALLAAVMIFIANVVSCRSVPNDKKQINNLQDATYMNAGGDDFSSVKEHSFENTLPSSDLFVPTVADRSSPQFPPQDYPDDPIAAFSSRKPSSAARPTADRASQYQDKSSQVSTMEMKPHQTRLEEPGYFGARRQPVYPAAPYRNPDYYSPQMFPPFVLPRVVVRGYYEPGYGYPEYIMM